MLKSTTDWAPIGSVAAAQAGQAEEDKNCSRLPGEKKTLRTSADIAPGSLPSLACSDKKI